MESLKEKVFDTNIPCKKPHNLFVLYLIAILILFLVCIYYGNYILWMIFVFGISLLLVDVGIFILALQKFKVVQSISSPIIERGEELALNLDINVSRKWRVLNNFIISYKFSGKKPTYKKVRKNIIIKFQPQDVGKHTFSVDYIYIESYFSLFVRKYKVSENPYSLECLVLPKLKKLDFEDRLVLNPNISASHLVFAKKEYDDYIGNKEYTPGDPIKLINFKKSAVQQKTLVKEYATPTKGPAISIFVDKFSPNNYNTVAEVVYAVNNFYLECRNCVTILNFFDGKQITYTEDIQNRLPTDLANYIPNIVQDFEYKPLNITTANLPIAVIISEYNENADFSIFTLLQSNSIIFLSSSGTKHKNEIEKILQEKNDNYKTILLFDEKSLLEMN